jgi:hypothetical protein
MKPCIEVIVSTLILFSIFLMAYFVWIITP